MRIMRLGPLFAFSALVFISPIRARQSSPSTTPTRDPQALTILTQCLQAAGGTQAVSAIQDFTASGSITYYWADNQVQGTVTIKGRGLTEFRMDASVQSGIRSFVVDGSHGSVKDIDGSTQTLPADDLVYLASPTFPSAQMELALQDTSTNITFVGLVNHNNRQVDDVRVQKAYGKADDPLGYRTKLATRDFYIDPTTFQVLSSQDSAHPKDNISRTCPHEMQFSNYQSTQGILVPNAITETVCGQTTANISLTQISFNTGLTDSDFQQ